MKVSDIKHDMDSPKTMLD